MAKYVEPTDPPKKNWERRVVAESHLGGRNFDLPKNHWAQLNRKKNNMPQNAFNGHQRRET
jgi:hypothetical protein